MGHLVVPRRDQRWRLPPLYRRYQLQPRTRLEKVTVDAHSIRELPHLVAGVSSAWWAATMRHRDLSGGTSELVYSFTLQLRLAVLAGLVSRLAIRMFEYETRKRFLALDQYLTHQADTFGS